MSQTQPKNVLSYDSPTVRPRRAGSQLAWWLLLFQCVLIIAACGQCYLVSYSKDGLYLGRPFIHDAPIEVYPLWAAGLLAFAGWAATTRDPSADGRLISPAGAALSICLALTLGPALLRLIDLRPPNAAVVAIDVGASLAAAIAQAVWVFSILRRRAAAVLTRRSLLCGLFVLWGTAFRLLDYTYIIADGELPLFGSHVMYVRAMGGEHETSYQIWQSGRVGLMLLAGAVVVMLLRLGRTEATSGPNPDA